MPGPDGTDADQDGDDARHGGIAGVEPTPADQHDKHDHHEHGGGESRHHREGDDEDPGR